MARAYGAARELLDDLVRLAELAFERREVASDAAGARALAATDLNLVAMGELVEARLAATGDRSVLPLETKLRMMTEDPTPATAGLVVDRVTTEGGLVIARFDRDGSPPRRYELPAAMVDRAFDEQASLAARFPALFTTSFVNVLRLLSIALLVALAPGCSQPAPHARPKDAAPVAPAPDAMPDAVAAPPDAPAAAPPHDLGPAWERLRDRRDRDAPRAAARVVGDEVRGSETRVILDRGRDAGVRPGWAGRFLDDRGIPTVELEIVEVERSRATARTTATHDRIAREPRVILWDPSRGDQHGW